MVQQLHLKIQGYILRREKGKSIAVSHEESSKKVRKHDVVVWIPMTTVQQEMYRKVLESSRVENILLAFENEAKTDGGNILLAMNELKQVCDGTKKREDGETNYVKPLDEQTSCKYPGRRFYRWVLRKARVYRTCPWRWYQKQS